MDKVIEERDEGYVLMYRRGRKEVGEWQWLDKNKTHTGDRLESVTTTMTMSFCLIPISVPVQTIKLSVIHPEIILCYYKCFRDLFQRTSSDLSIH
jgi:hypothetical protein